jgi:uncharacterized membrane protein
MKKMLATMAQKMPKNLPLVLLSALILLCLTWELFLAPLPTRSGWPWFAIKIIPLALAMRGFMQDKLYTYKWMSLTVWLYFIEGTVRGWSDRGLSSPLAWAEAVLSVLLFTAVVIRIRQIRPVKI